MVTPTRVEILERLRGLVRGKINVDPAELQPQAELADIGVDSFALIELVFLVEDEFGITIPTEGLNVRTVDDVLDVIQRRSTAALG